MIRASSSRDWILLFSSLLSCVPVVPGRSCSVNQKTYFSLEISMFSSSNNGGGVFNDKVYPWELVSFNSRVFFSRSSDWICCLKRL